MCVPACTQKVAQDMSRRGFLRTAVGAATVAGLAGCAPISASMPASKAASNKVSGTISFGS